MSDEKIIDDLFEAARSESAVRSLTSVKQLIQTAPATSTNLLVQWLKQNKMNMLISTGGILITAAIFLFPKQETTEKSVISETNESPMEQVEPEGLPETKQVIEPMKEGITPNQDFRMVSNEVKKEKKVVDENPQKDSAEVLIPDPSPNIRAKLVYNEPKSVLLEPELTQHSIVLESNKGRVSAKEFSEYMTSNLSQLSHEFTSTATKNEIKKFILKLENRYEASFRMKVTGFVKLELHWEENADGKVRNMWYRLDSEEMKELDFSKSKEFSIRINHKRKSQTEIPSKQDVLDKFGFTEHFIKTHNDTIAFYLFKNPNSEPKNIVLYLQGTSPDPIFVIEEKNGEYKSYRWIPSDFKILDKDFCYVIIAKVGIPSFFYKDTKRNISKYQRFNSLDYRTFQADTVINHISEYLLKNTEKVIVYGHSEGARVAAKLGSINKKITHIGFWASNALPDFFDFVLFNTKGVSEGRLTKRQAFSNLDTLINGFAAIANNPDDVSYKDHYDYTNKRWLSYAEPPINDLLKIDIPIFVQVAGKDESAPVETAYLIPLEFTRLRKTNLTFQVCIECDHGFEIEKENGEIEDQWPEIFQNFINWTEENAH